MTKVIIGNLYKHTLAQYEYDYKYNLGMAGVSSGHYKIDYEQAAADALQKIAALSPSAGGDSGPAMIANGRGWLNEL